MPAVPPLLPHPAPPRTQQVVPIFASAPAEEGGLGFSTSQLAPSLTFGGGVLMVWALAGYPAMLRRLGPVR